MSSVINSRFTPDQLELVGRVAQHVGLSRSETLRQATLAGLGSVGAGWEVGQPYRFDGAGQYSILADIQSARYNPDAAQRLGKFQQWQTQLFTTVTTGGAPQLIPPGYRDTFIVPVDDRPLTAMATRLPLSDSTPFTLPGTVTSSDGAQVHDEGDPPAAGSLEFSGGTVTPRSIVGRFEVSRELLDSSSPAADLVAIAAARADYNRRAEQRVLQALQTAQQGVPDQHTVPSGTQVRVAANAGALPDVLRQTLADHAFRAGTSATDVALSRDAAAALALPLDSQADRVTGGWLTRDLAIRPAPSMLQAEPGEADVFVSSPGQLYVWESPLLELRYSERSGPGLVELVVFGYQAAHVVRARGLSAVRIGEQDS